MPESVTDSRGNRPWRRLGEIVDKVVKTGLRDGRKRFIMKILHPYCANVLNYSLEECLELDRKLIENSCKNFNHCSEIKERWLQYDLTRVKERGIKPKSLKKLEEEDPELYQLINNATTYNTT